jgi:Zn-dependent metalloprotease
MKTILFLSFITIMSLSCQKKQTLHYSEWSTGQPESAKVALLNIEHEKSGATAHYKNKSISFYRQSYSGLPIYNSFLKTVSDKKGLQLVQAQITETKEFNQIDNRPDFTNLDFTNLLNKSYKKFNKIEIINQEEVIYLDGSKPIRLMLVNFFDHKGIPYQALFNSNGSLFNLKRTGSHFADINTSLYVEGPKLGGLTDILLKSVSATPALSNLVVNVTSEADKKITTLTPVLKFDPKDARFDQLQVFYYLDKSFSWMKENLHVHIPTQINAVVHMGYPEKTNSAFYFQNKIRIGKGDDITYSNIPQDASIIFHESFHALIDNVAHLSFEGENGSLNEAFADFFTCLMTDRPLLGESSYLKGPFKRNLNQGFKYSEKTGGLYHDSLIASSLLWELKEKLGNEKVKTLAIETLLQLNPASDLKMFSQKLIDASKTLSAEDQNLVLQAIGNKGF